MSNRRRARKPFISTAEAGRRGGIISAHRFGTDGDWNVPRVMDQVVYVAELIGASAGPHYFHCGDCDSITTGLFDPATGICRGVGITHSPGCPWLTAAARTWTRST